MLLIIFRRNDFVTVRKNLEDVKETHVHLIISYHLDLLKKSIVYDAHSTNWEDDKPLFEVGNFWKGIMHGKKTF